MTRSLANSATVQLEREQRREVAPPAPDRNRPVSAQPANVEDGWITGDLKRFGAPPQLRADVIGSSVPPVAGFAHSWRKRMFDMVVAAAGLALSGPLLVGAALAIRLTSRGPVLHRQRRIGLGGEPFTLIKFRTMYTGSDESVHRSFITSLITAPDAASPIDGVYKLAHDARVTSIGRLLRKTSIDELPQLINVLRGEMSIVGPRPPLPYEVEVYDAWQLERLTARPGITGAWQVGGRNRVSYTDMCRMDIAYIHAWSMRRDVEIVLRTPLALMNVGETA